MHILHIFHNPLIIIATLLLAVGMLYLTLQNIIKYEFEGNASRGLYTFTAIFGIISLLGTLATLGLLIGCLT